MIIITIILLALMEVSLSFDNAVINASILQRMDPKWQNRFLTWGMPVAVFGMRLLFPVLIVAMASHLSLQAVTVMAIDQPDAYAQLLGAAHVKISAFGGIFLLMVFFSFIMDAEKKVHWLSWIEKPLAGYGVIDGITCVMAIGTLCLLQHFIPGAAGKLEVLMFGLAGVMTFMLIEGLSALTGLGDEKAITGGLASLIYLEVLDASCSFDGVIGAFVLTNNIVLIMIGLGIGALAIRSLTLYLVRGGQLKEFIYLEHGAHYGIGALAAIMLTDIFYPVPEPVTGMMGMSFILLSLVSSVRHNRKKEEGELARLMAIGQKNFFDRNFGEKR